MHDKYFVDCYDIYLIQSEYRKVATFGRHHKRNGAAFGRATSFVVSFVLALNKVDIVAVTTILVLHVSSGRSEHVCLDTMFLASRASSSLAVRAMRACAQGRSGLGRLAPWAGFLGGPSAHQGSLEGRPVSPLQD